MSDFKQPVPSSELIDVRTTLDAERIASWSEALNRETPVLPLDVRTSIETENRKLVDNVMLPAMSIKLPMRRMGE